MRAEASLAAHHNRVGEAVPSWLYDDDHDHTDADAPNAPPPLSEARAVVSSENAPDLHENGGPASPWRALDAAAIFAPLEPVNYLLEPLDLCPGAPALVAGYGFSGKTVALQAAAVAIAANQPVWGTFKARHGRVLHIDYEQGAHLTRSRYQRIAAAMMVTPDELAGRLELVSLPQLYLDNPGNEASLTKKVRGFDLAIVDSLRAAGPTLEENDSTVRALLDMLTRISERTGCCFVVIHHARKPMKDGAGGGGAKMAIRGSGAIFDACSSVLILEAEKGQPTRCTHEKARTSGICADDFILRIEDHQIGDDPRGGLLVTAEAKPPTQGPSSSFAALMERALTELEASGPAASKTALAARVKGKLADKYAAIDQLVADGRIKVTGKRHEVAK